MSHLLCVCSFPRSHAYALWWLSSPTSRSHCIYSCLGCLVAQGLSGCMGRGLAGPVEGKFVHNSEGNQRCISMDTLWYVTLSIISSGRRGRAPRASAINNSVSCCILLLQWLRSMAHIPHTPAPAVSSWFAVFNRDYKAQLRGRWAVLEQQYSWWGQTDVGDKRSTLNAVLARKFDGGKRQPLFNTALNLRFAVSVCLWCLYVCGVKCS